MLDYYTVSEDYDEDILRNSSLSHLDLSRNDIAGMRRDLRVAERRRRFQLRIVAEELR